MISIPYLTPDPHVIQQLIFRQRNKCLTRSQVTEEVPGPLMYLTPNYEAIQTQTAK